MTETLPANLRRLLPYLPGLANAILVIMIGLAAARLFWLLWPQAELPVTADLAAHDRGADGAAPVNIDTIAAANLFGEKTTAETAAYAEEIEAPETRLNLILTGIISSRSGERSRAMIKSGNRDQRAYGVGDTVAGGVKLHAIYANRVILDRGGRYETLTLEQEKTAAESVRRIERGERVTAAAAEELGTIRRELLNDPSKISQYIRLQPERRNGTLIGYRIYPARERELFNELGLKPGELVTAVNGIELSSTRGNMEVLRKLSEANNITVTLGSGTGERTMSVSFQ